MFCYITPLFGGMLADSSLGKFKTILILSVVYCAGTAVMSATAIPGLTGDPPSPAGAMIGLSLIAIGTGGIKPCVASFVRIRPPPKPSLQLTRSFSNS